MKNDGLLRVLRPADFRKAGRIYRNGTELIDFSSNDYLGLAGHPELKKASKKAIERFGAGSSASRLLSGDLKIHHELEEKTALFKGKRRALVFNSGYQANVGIISALCKTGDAVFCDKLSHASILDGVLLSGARLFRFRHNDTGHLESLLKKTRGKYKERLIVTESVFSMDGDIPPLEEMVRLKTGYGCRIMVDEAHATGIFGEDGSGLVAETGLVDDVDLIMGTFSKALGSFGAYAAGSTAIIEFLINTCRSFIYSTSLPASVIAADIAALRMVQTQPSRRKRVLENAAFFRAALQSKGFEVKGQSQIVPLITGRTQRTVELSKRLEAKGFWVLPIRPPTVPGGQGRLRFSLTYHHTKEILLNLIENIEKVGNV